MENRPINKPSDIIEIDAFKVRKYSQLQVCDIRFGAVVVMEGKPVTYGQWYHIDMAMTFEHIKYMPAEALGIQLKDMLSKLDAHVKKNERSK
jgi:hypothetical protein